MKKLLLIFLMLSLYACGKKHIYYPAIKGVVYSKETKLPLDKVEIYKPGALINNPDTTKTNNKGEFLIDGEIHSYNPYTFKNDERIFIIKHMAYTNTFKRDGYEKKDINIKYFDYSRDHIDTINLGKIYLEKE